MMQCKICGSSSNLFGEMLVLSKHQVKFFRCTDCGFIQSQDPFWLDEAYSSAIARQDVGIMQRNENNARATTALLNINFPKMRNALDFGGGHGVFVRMMRDRGFNFHWRDLYASNNFARGFEFEPTCRYDFLTAFEVFEHFVDPMSELEQIMQLSRNVFITTLPVPDPPPSLTDWWYFAPSTGQHISFFTAKSLQKIADRFHCHLVSHDAYHLFSEAPVNPFLFRLALRNRFTRILNEFKRRPSLIEADHLKLVGKPRL